MAHIVCYAVLSLTSLAVSVRDHGAVGDAATDDTAAVRAALAESSHVHFPAGVYRITDGLDLPPGARLTGEGSPALAPFPMIGDDKRRLAPEKKATLPGTVLLFTGRGGARQSTGRTDAFASLRYAMRTTPDSSFTVRDLAIVCDIDVHDRDGRLTPPDADRRADYDVGLLVDDSFAGTVRDVSVFGYWNRAGVAVVSRGVGDNPDYNAFWNCAIMGDVGVALLGRDDAPGPETSGPETPGPGLSGTQFHGCRIFAGDHHDRRRGGAGRAAVYIDGDTPAKRADINGHAFFGGCIRTYANTAVELDHASNVSFHGVVFEVPAYRAKDKPRDAPEPPPVVPESSADDVAPGRERPGRITGTANTRDVFFFGCRMHDLKIRELAESMTDGRVYAFPGPFDQPVVHPPPPRR